MQDPPYSLAHVIKIAASKQDFTLLYLVLCLVKYATVVLLYSHSCIITWTTDYNASFKGPGMMFICLSISKLVEIFDLTKVLNSYQIEVVLSGWTTVKFLQDISNAI